jgi:protein phosphatase
VLRAFGFSDKGRVRPINEDCFAIHEELGLCVIADGLGGHNAGEVAAQLAVDAVVQVIRDPDAALARRTGEGGDGDWPFGYDPSLTDDGNLLRTAVHVASTQVLEAASTEELAGMGTTIVAVRVLDGRLSVAHAGDSRLYLLAGDRLCQMTQDDSWIASMMAEDPSADLDTLRLHPMRNALTNVVGARTPTMVHVAERTLVGGERLLLSTDGVHGVIDGAQLERMMRAHGDPQMIARNLICEALACGSRDNCTAVVAEYKPLGGSGDRCRRES